MCLALTSRAACAAPPLEAYGDLPGVEDMAISSSGKFLAAAARVEGERRVILYDVAGNILAVRNLGDLKFDSVTWAGDQFAILKLRNTVDLGTDFTADKAELATAVILPVEGGQEEQVFAQTPLIPDMIVGSYGVRSVDGKWYGYFGGLKYRRAYKTELVLDHDRPALFAVDLEKNKPEQLAISAPEGFWRDWLLDAESRVAAILELAYQSGNWTIENAQRKVIASGTQKNGAIDLLSLGKDGSSVIYRLEDNVDQTVRLMEVALSGGDSERILEDIGIRRFFIDPTNSQMLGYLLESSEKTVLFDEKKQVLLNKVYRAFAGKHVRVAEWTPSFSHLLVHTSGEGDSGTWFLVDVAKLKAEPVGHDRPLIGPGDVGPMSTVHYTAADGLEMDGILTLPPGREAKNLPVIMFPHGGPRRHDEVQFDWWAQAFASRGYAVFQPNFRGSTNRDLAFERAGYGQWGRKMQSDISDGLAALVKRGIADPKRACIMGASYGGYAALAGVTLQQGLYRCVVAVSPVSDVKLMYKTAQHETNYNRMTTRALIDALGDPEKYDEISPRKHAERADAPILLIHGKDDTRVLFNQSTVMADALKNAGKPFEFIVLKEEDHFLSRSATRKQMLEEAMRFVQKYNPAD